MSYVPPTVAEIRTVSRVIFAEYGFGEPTGSDPDPLEQLLVDAQAELTGSLLLNASLELNYEKVDLSTPVGRVLKTLLDKIIRMWVEWLAASSNQEVVDTASDFDLMASSGGSGGSHSHRQVSSNLHMWHIWPALDRLMHFLVKIWNEELTVSELPPDVPVVQNHDFLPRPGEFVMGRARTISPFAPPQTVDMRRYS